MFDRLGEYVHQAREKRRLDKAVAKDPDVCRDCGHPRAVHPVPYGPCESCIKDGQTHIVCGQFVSSHTEGFVR